jgi:hypothetical protein
MFKLCIEYRQEKYNNLCVISLSVCLFYDQFMQKSRSFQMVHILFIATVYILPLAYYLKYLCIPATSHFSTKFTCKSAYHVYTDTLARYTHPAPMLLPYSLLLLLGFLLLPVTFSYTIYLHYIHVHIHIYTIYKSIWTPLQMSGFGYFSPTRC